MLKTSLQSVLLVFLQFTILVILVTSTPFHSFPLAAVILLALAVALMAWSIAVMSTARLRIFPEPDAHTRLVKNGPYRLIRHPMYTALLLGCIGLVLADNSWWRWLLVCMLAGILIIKLRYEESFLQQKFPDYATYRKESYYLLPYIF